MLELGCGTGRVLIPLIQAGFHTIGIDNDLAMLRFLRDSLTEGIPAPSIFVSDITCFNLSLKVPLIILPCNTFSTLAKNERAACLRGVKRHLPPSGLFSVSIPNPDYLNSLPARSAAQLEDEFLHPQTGNPVQVSSSWRRTKSIFQVTWMYDHLFPNGRVERLTSVTSQHLLPADGYLDEIRAAGLDVVELYGDFDCSPYQQVSPYLICVTRN